MSHCQKCGRVVGEEGGAMRDVEDGSLGNSLVCRRCAGEIDEWQAQKGRSCLIMLGITAAALAILYFLSLQSS